MNTKVLNYEEVLKNFLPYHESLKDIQIDKKEFSDLIEEIKKEMETIANSSRSIIMDESTNQRNQVRFRELQTKAIQAENEFKSKISDKQNNEFEKNLNLINDIVSKFSQENNIQMVINSSSLVYHDINFDITNDILESLKAKELYLEYREGMYDVVE